MTHIFTKNYTRESSLIVQQAWFDAHNDVIETYLPNLRGQLFGIDVISDGVFEIWENKKILDEIKKMLVVLSFEKKRDVLRILHQHQKNLPHLHAIREKLVLPKKALLEFIERMREPMFACVLYSYLSTANAEPEVKKTAADIRREDHFFADSTAIIRASVQALFPEYAQYADYIPKHELLNDMPPVRKFKNRYPCFINTSEGKQYTSSLHDFQRNNPPYTFVEETADASVDIKGQTARPGRAHGKARIIRKVSDASKMKKGEIVVSPMTTPDMLMALKHASAIITDEGGTLCHASLVARELGIPCIIGTRIATKVLKDGDTVEVDAEKGVIRKLLA